MGYYEIWMRNIATELLPIAEGDIKYKNMYVSENINHMEWLHKEYSTQPYMWRDR